MTNKQIFTFWLLLLAALPLAGQVPYTVTFSVQDGADDAEEAVATGAMNLSSSDLEMTMENTEQIIGIRFAGVNLPQGAVVNSVYIQFTTDETDDVATSLVIHGEMTDNSAAFTNNAFDISSRTRTADSVLWPDIAPWDQVGEAGEDQRTPDLTALVNEIINQPGWAAGNAMTFIISGTGKRNAISFNNNANSPARLVINYDVTEFPVEAFPVSADALWRYNDSGMDLDTAWRDPAFDDSGWPFGQAELGYGDGDEQTVLDFGGDPDNKHITYYFRKTFSVDDPGQYDALNLRLQRDDGAVVYLNGVEIARSNMPEGPVDYQTLAAETVGGADESTFFSFELENMLQAGENVLAVEVHQADPTSSDISFNLSFSGNVILPPAIQLIHNSPDPVMQFVDVYVDVLNQGNFAKINGNTPVPFRFGTPYLTDLPPGTHSIAVSPFGAEDFEWSATEFTLENNKRYIIMVSGVRDTANFETTFNSGEQIAFKIQINEVPGPDAVDAGESLPLLFHGTPDLPNIRVIAVGAGDATGDLPEGLPYGFDLLGGAVDAFTFPIVQITNNATTEVYGEYKVDLVPFAEQVVTIFTSGFFTAEGDAGVNSSNFALMLMPPSGGAAIPLPAPDPPLPGKIQIIHNSPDPGLNEVDVWVNGEKAVEALAFREATPYVDIPAGRNRVAVSPHSTTEADTAWSATDVVVEADLDLNFFRPVGRTYAAVAFGARETGPFENDVNADVSFGLAIAEGRQSAVSDTVADLRFFHGATDASGVDAVLEGQFIPIVNNLEYGDFSPVYASLPANEVFEVNLTDQNDNMAVLNGYELDLTERGGEALIILASGLLQPAEAQPAFGLYAAGADGGALLPLPLVVGTGLEELRAVGIRVFPNPAADVLRVQGDNALPPMRLLDTAGRELRRLKGQNLQEELNVSNLAPGLYLLEFRLPQGVQSVKILKQ